MDISQIIDELKKILPESNFYKQPETSKHKLSEYERKYEMSTFEFVNLKKDISNISEIERLDWLDSMETYCNFGGIIEGVNN
ncbi:hypothetical protein QH639_19160 [Lysinibacillus sp. 1 U-2021]|uniref:hypothetical protein n=1 Tax=Lysinibacillus sp. 1 U-2021 TaxID=3039426 RepID=UPI0024806CEC|nr:hypothetical protein [Lysinibacillus sp. 1 U-2021]WGT37922.1 hypothetical protein QH639_19160 [Lysinibacillus sp. 1 U-2021]